MKIKSNIAALRQDADLNPFFGRELEHVQGQLEKVEHPELLARTIIPSDPDPGPAGADTLTYQVIEHFGKAARGRAAPTTIPRADIAGAEVTQKVVRMYDAFGYEVEEIEASNMAGKNLDVERAFAAEQALAEDIDDLISLGDAAYGLEGFLNHSSVDAEASSGAWDAPASADTILAEVSLLVSQIFTDTKGIFQATDLALPLAAYSHISTTARSTTSDTTILQYILQNFPSLNTIFPWYRLDDVGGATKAVAFAASPRVVRQAVQLEPSMLPPQEQNFEIVVNMRAKSSGVQVRHPKAMHYLTGL